METVWTFLWFPSSTSSNVFMVSVVGLLMVPVVTWNVIWWFPSLVCWWFPSWQENTFYGFRRWIVGGFCRRRRIQNVRMYGAVPRFLVFLGLVSVAGFLMVSVVAGKRCLWFPSLVCWWFLSWQGTFFYGFRRCYFMDSGCYRTAAVSPMETVNKTSGRFRDELSNHIYVYMYIYI